MDDKYARLLDSTRRPTERSILTALGKRVSVLWKQLRVFLKMNYDYKPELLFGGRKYGWCYKYRRKNKTLCVLFPEMKAFTVLVVLGKQEIMQFVKIATRFSDNTRKLFESAYQYHDGKWLYKRTLNKSDLEDVIALIRIKRNPRERGQ